jgi:hypothetical protein
MQGHKTQGPRKELCSTPAVDLPVSGSRAFVVARNASTSILRHTSDKSLSSKLHDWSSTSDSLIVLLTGIDADVCSFLFV